MNNIYKVLIGAAVGLLIGLVIGWALAGNSYGGVTNYDSLQLQPSSSSDDALDVRNSGGTSRLVVSGSGVITLSGATTISGTAALSSTLTVSGETQLSTLVHGGDELSMASSTTRFSSSTGVYTMTAADICNNSIISVEDWTGAPTGTAIFALPTVTTLFADCLDTHGDVKEFLFRNEASTAGSSTRIVAGTNIVLTESDNSSGADVVIAGSNSATIKLWRLNATATSSGVQVYVEELRDAD